MIEDRGEARGLEREGAEGVIGSQFASPGEFPCSLSIVSRRYLPERDQTVPQSVPEMVTKVAPVWETRTMVSGCARHDLPTLNVRD
jgi:hypothetical protein